MKDENKIQTKQKQPSMFIDTRKKEEKKEKKAKESNDRQLPKRKDNNSNKHINKNCTNKKKNHKRTMWTQLQENRKGKKNIHTKKERKE